MEYKNELPPRYDNWIQLYNYIKREHRHILDEYSFKEFLDLGVLPVIKEGFVPNRDIWTIDVYYLKNKCFEEIMSFSLDKAQIISWHKNIEICMYYQQQNDIEMINKQKEILKFLLNLVS